jgi:hypothetical protein
VYRSTDAGNTFTDISGNLPDIPADFSLVRNGHLIVATDLGVYESADTAGGPYELLGAGLPNAPVLSLELKPKQTATEPDVLVVATQGRGVYCYAFSDPDKGSAPNCGGVLQQSAARPAASRPSPAVASTTTTSPTACKASRPLAGATARGAGRRLQLGFTRRVAKPVTVDVLRVPGSKRVAHFANRSKRFTWNGAGVSDGYYVARFRLAGDTQQLALRRAHGRWSRLPAFAAAPECSALKSFALSSPVFDRAHPLRISARPAGVVTVRHGGDVVKRWRSGGHHTFSARPRGVYRVTLTTGGVTRTLTSRRL